MAGRFKMRRLRGFTLVEMIIVVAIIAIVMSYAVPAYNRFVAQNKVQSFAYALAADLRRAPPPAAVRPHSGTRTGSCWSAPGAPAVRY